VGHETRKRATTGGDLAEGEGKGPVSIMSGGERGSQRGTRGAGGLIGGTEKREDARLGWGEKSTLFSRVERVGGPEKETSI